MDLLKSLSIASGKGNELAAILSSMYKQHKDSKLASLEPLLPLLFSHNGDPVTLRNHFPMEPLFDISQTPDFTLMCSRQVGKTMNLSLRTILNALFTPFWKPLIITPLFETVRRISTDYYSALLDQSPARSLFNGDGCTRQVLERSFPNKSRLRFTYALRNGDRARGIPANECLYDEFQMIFPEVLPVTNATMNASPYGNIITAAGTPITNANGLSVRYKDQSTQSHWCVKCEGCGHKNVAAAEYDLIKMIGPLRDDIGKDRPALVCAQCRNPIFPWTGYWVHLNPERRKFHVGLHVPCIVLPEHCCNFDKWRTIVNTLGDPNIAQHTKFNEILGVPFDDGVALLTQLDLLARAVLGPNTVENALSLADHYSGRVALGIDWGGRGMSGKSLTKVAVVGLRPDLTTHIIFGVQLTKDASSAEEAAVINFLYRTFRPQMIAHDNLGIGQRAEEMLVAAGIPPQIFMPMEYAGETQGLIMKRRDIPDSTKVVFNVDKTRSLLHLVEAYKHDVIFSFNMSEAYHANELLLDMTHIRAELQVYVKSVKSETILIQAEPNQCDDFIHAVNHACNALWYHYGWPEFGKPITVLTPQDLSNYIVSMQRALDQASIDALGLMPLASAT